MESIMFRMGWRRPEFKLEQLGRVGWAEGQGWKQLRSGSLGQGLLLHLWRLGGMGAWKVGCIFCRQPWPPLPLLSAACRSSSRRHGKQVRALLASHVGLGPTGQPCSHTPCHPSCALCRHPGGHQGLTLPGPMPWLGRGGQHPLAGPLALAALATASASQPTSMPALSGRPAPHARSAAIPLLHFAPSQLPVPVYSAAQLPQVGGCWRRSWVLPC